MYAMYFPSGDHTGWPSSFKAEMAGIGAGEKAGSAGLTIERGSTGVWAGALSLTATMTHSASSLARNRSLLVADVLFIENLLGSRTTLTAHCQSIRLATAVIMSGCGLTVIERISYP